MSSTTLGRSPPTPSPRRSVFTALRLGRLFGVEVQLDWSVLVIFALIMVNLGVGLFPAWHPDWDPLLSWGTAAAAAVLLLLSILLHELSHALVGRAQGIDVDRITLFVFGGVAHMRGEPKRPRAELLMAGVGPITSFLIGAGAIVLGLLLAPDRPWNATTVEELEDLVRELKPLPTLLLWLGPINIALAVFNLVPGFPLDGGRVLRALLWGATGDFVKATRWAAFAGQVVAWCLMGWGVMQALAGGVGQGLWLVLIGWFLLGAARSSVGHALLRETLSDVPVERVMISRLGTVPPDLDVERFVNAYFMTSDQRAWPVEDGGRLVGLVTGSHLERVDRGAWSTTRLAEVMTPRAALVTLPLGATAIRALEVFSEHAVDAIVIVEGDRLQGLVHREELLKYIVLHRDEPPRAAPMYPVAR